MHSLNNLFNEYIKNRSNRLGNSALTSYLQKGQIATIRFNTEYNYRTFICSEIFNYLEENNGNVIYLTYSKSRIVFYSMFLQKKNSKNPDHLEKYSSKIFLDEMNKYKNINEFFKTNSGHIKKKETLIILDGFNNIFKKSDIILFNKLAKANQCTVIYLLNTYNNKSEYEFENLAEINLICKVGKTFSTMLIKSKADMILNGSNLPLNINL